ncbi:MAG: UvrD-helicase domain-containing protein [Alphaproteobacteria bacterium]
MQTAALVPDLNDVDAGVDKEIASCLSLKAPKSFFLFAGAGSGKTRSLVTALQHLRDNYSRHLRLHGQRIAVITYTNKASDEIKHRVGYDPLIEVSTIHSFVWTLIQGLNNDIRAWLKKELQAEIIELEEKERTGRAGTKASQDRLHDIASKKKRLENLDAISKFIYNPNGENKGKDSLNHSEVIKISASFLLEKATMQNLLIKKFPILLIDESQDTNKSLMDAFLAVQNQHPDFILGLFGDLMQRIYADGKEDLGRNIPAAWATPKKQMNHRCPKRVVTLINKLREDGQEQQPRTDANEGVVRLFILNANTLDKTQAEMTVAQKMAEFSHDEGWNKPNEVNSSKLAEVKRLILEHHMAAKRMGFLDMYEPLYRDKSLRIGLLDGTLSGIKLFSERVLPLLESQKDKFAVAALVRKYSPLVSKSILLASGDKQSEQIQKAKLAVENLFEIFSNEQSPRFLDVLKSIAATGLFEIPEGLSPIVNRTPEEQKVAEEEISRRRNSGNSVEETTLDCWDEFLLTPFEQIKAYSDYINEIASFDTHQGVKGLEFPRVMVIIDDSEAKGFLFSYDKLFGIKAKTDADIKNEREGRENTIDRTKRLFYVTCSRAEKSLAIVAYTTNPQLLKTSLIQQGWFTDSEVEIMDSAN